MVNTFSVRPDKQSYFGPEAEGSFASVVQRNRSHPYFQAEDGDRSCPRNEAFYFFIIIEHETMGEVLDVNGFRWIQSTPPCSFKTSHAVSATYLLYNTTLCYITFAKVFYFTSCVLTEYDMYRKNVMLCIELRSAHYMGSHWVVRGKGAALGSRGQGAENGWKKRIF